MKQDHCEKPFWEDPGVIFRDFTLQYNPYCTSQTWNFGTRLVIIAIIIGLVGSAFAGLNAFIVSLLFALITAFVIVITTYPAKKNRWGEYKELPSVVEVQPRLTQPKPDVIGQAYLSPSSIGEGFSEGFSSHIITKTNEVVGVEEIDAAAYSGPSLPDFTPPTSRNPFMNVLLDEYKYNPQRPAAAPVTNPTVKQTLDDYFRVQWFSDPTDVFGKNQGQRQFVTQPSTSVPNNREAYQNWLYKIPGKTCKEGGREACSPGTDGGPVTWLNQDS